METTLNAFTRGLHIRAAIISKDGSFTKTKSLPGDTPVYPGDIVVACGMAKYPYRVFAATYTPNNFFGTEWPIYHFTTGDGSPVAKIVDRWR